MYKMFFTELTQSYVDIWISAVIFFWKFVYLYTKTMKRNNGLTTEALV